MATLVQTAEVMHAPGELAVDGVQEPALVRYEGLVWSCAEKREIPARLYYSVTNEQQRTTYRLLFIEPLIQPQC